MRRPVGMASTAIASAVVALALVGYVPVAAAQEASRESPKIVVITNGQNALVEPRSESIVEWGSAPAVLAIGAQANHQRTLGAFGATPPGELPIPPSQAAALAQVMARHLSPEEIACLMESVAYGRRTGLLGADLASLQASQVQWLAGRCGLSPGRLATIASDAMTELSQPAGEPPARQPAAVAGISLERDGPRSGLEHMRAETAAEAERTAAAPAAPRRSTGPSWRLLVLGVLGLAGITTAGVLGSYLAGKSIARPKVLVQRPRSPTVTVYRPQAASPQRPRSARPVTWPPRTARSVEPIRALAAPGAWPRPAA